MAHEGVLESVLLAKFVFQTLPDLFFPFPDFSALKVYVLRDQTWSQGFAHEGRVLAVVRRLVHEQANLANVVHYHVFQLDVTHVPLFVVQDPELGERTNRGDGALLVPQSFSLRRIRQRVLHALDQLLLPCLSPLFSDVVVVHVGVEPCVNYGLRLAVNFLHFGHHALLEHFVEHLGVLDLKLRL